MSAHKNIDKICMAIIAVTLVITILFCNGQALGIKTTAHAVGYENRIFDNSKVHTLDIVINDWDSFLETCESEEYSPCNVVIDGEAIKNVGIRGKGNSSLKTVSSMDSSRYSLKIEFGHYDSAKSYHGLDKLCLNNIIQDNTYMKDYLSYTLMENFGADTPLCSYVYITVNGEDWGLYLAVEGVEDSFLKRNYGSDSGELYKPDSTSLGGGPGNGKDFDMEDFLNRESSDSESSDNEGRQFAPPMNFADGEMPGFGKGEMPEFNKGNMPDDFDPSQMFGKDGDMPDSHGGMGSDDVKLKYIDDDIDSYPNIFNTAKTDVSTADKKRLIASLKSLSEMNDIESTVDVDEVLRYFVVHNFLCNGDSYTGQMIHNYYLYEKDGQLSMIPWDYNLAFGSFQGMNASSSVNAAIDTPVSGDMSDRPMIAWIFESEEYTNRYHELFSEFISETDFESMINETAALIDEYVKKDPTKFCTYEEYQTGLAAIAKFCELRSESVTGQLSGTIPSTTDGQKADSSALIDSSSLDISDMGTMNMGMGGGFGGNNGGNRNKATATNTSNIQMPNGGNMPPDFNGEMPEGFGGEMPKGFGGEMPEGSDGEMSKGFGGEMPEGFDGEMPEGFGGEKPEGFSRPDMQNENSDSDEQKTTDSDFNRPFMDRFPSMNDNSKTNNTAALILLGISAGVLIIGIAFAAKYKR